MHDHGGKGQRLYKALVAAGHEFVEGTGDIAVIDHDFYRDVCDAHEVVVLYPHGGTPILSWDIAPIHPHVRLNLVHGPGHAEVMATYGFDVPTEVIGWSYSELAEPRYPAKVRKVIFGPTHPLSNGRLQPELAEANDRTLRRLVDAGYDVDVRLWGWPEDWGLDPRLPVRWTRGGYLDHDDIDQADLVVAGETLLALAVARGCPALAIASDIKPDGAHDGEAVYPPHWDECHELMRYPFDVDDGPLEELVPAVAGLVSDHSAVAEWRRRFVGGPFEADRAVQLIEAAVERTEAMA